MAGIIVALNLNELTCNDTCIGPGSDTISVQSRVDDITDKKNPVLILGTDVTLGPWEMDTKKNVQGGAKGVFQVGQTPFFKALKYERKPPATGATPDNILLTVVVLKGDAVVNFNIPIELSFQGGKIGITVPVGKVIGKIVDLFEDQVIGKNSDVVDNTKASGPNGQQFSYVCTGDGSSYKITYTINASAF